MLAGGVATLAAPWLFAMLADIDMDNMQNITMCNKLFISILVRKQRKLPYD
jgi:hypothetical protein